MPSIEQQAKEWQEGLGFNPIELDDVIAFARQVAREERERIAKLMEEFSLSGQLGAAAIRSLEDL